MPGPPPKDPTLKRRRTATPGFKVLPHEGRQGEPPEFPLPAAHPEEVKMWNALWTLPQAIEWERMRNYDMVALYVRTYIAATLSVDNTKLLAEVRQLDAKIGLSPRAMREMRWETDEPNGEEPEDDASAVKTKPREPEQPRAFVPTK